ncbi:MAG: homoserine acetyltransferase [Cyanobium sp. CACIAM 14]|nr:MAG: homoserine acetyltransferase [Cyanobium sp. CACIAM 14]
MATLITSPMDTSRTRHGGWRPGDPVGRRRFIELFNSQGLRLESGDLLGPITIAYESWGTLDAAGRNGVLLLHGFSGDSHAAGPIEPGHPTRGWWDGLIGPGRAIDTDRYFVVCPNVLGGCQGSTGPSSPAPDGRPWGSRFPALTIRDLVAAEVAFADHLGIPRWHTVIGGSMGGMRAMEWAIGHPERLERLVLLATTARCSAETMAFHHCQIRAILQDSKFLGGDYYGHPRGGPLDGLTLARTIARLTYGSEREISQRLATVDSDVTPQAMAAYLAAEAQAFVERFDANSYLVLTRAMSSHDVGRDRGGMAPALATIAARVRVVSISSDRLFPPQRQQELAQAIGNAVTYSTIDSHHGHDGFLLEQRQLEPILRQSLG